MSLIKNNNGITLRLEKSNSLTFDEMDQNFSSFFYSASTVQSGDTNKLRLFYTGSNELDSGFEADRYMEVLLPSTPEFETPESVSVPGLNTQVIFNSNNSFGASNDFVFKNKRLGIGLSNPAAPIEITSAESGVPSAIMICSNAGTGASSRGYFELERNGNTLFRLGKTTAGNSNDNIHLFTCTTLEIGCSNFDGTTDRKIRVNGNGVAIGSGISSNAVTPLTVKGDLTIGSEVSTASLNYIGGLGGTNLANLLPSDSSLTKGLLLQSQKDGSGGHVAVGINSSGNCHESFSILRGEAGTFNCSVATFKANGNVGIGQVNPKAKLHVEGNISGSGNFKVHGSATIQTIATKANFCSTSTLVATSAGTVQQMDAAPIPRGGIIMWSGTKENIPKGWKLCDAETVINGVRVPNLVSRFVIGGVGDHDFSGTKRVYTNVEGSSKKCYIGGSSSHTHGGDTCAHTLKICEIPCHRHSTPGSAFKNFAAMANEYGYNSSTGKATDNCNPSSELAIGNLCSTAVTAMEENAIGDGKSHKHGIPSDNHIPPYYALAFIIYVGQ